MFPHADSQGLPLVHLNHKKVLSPKSSRKHELNGFYGLNAPGVAPEKISRVSTVKGGE